MTQLFIGFIHRFFFKSTENTPKRWAAFVLYYLTVIAVSFIVISMIILCMEAYGFDFFRNQIYKWLGSGLLGALEKFFF